MKVKNMKELSESLLDELQPMDMKSAGLYTGALSGLKDASRLATEVSSIANPISAAVSAGTKIFDSYQTYLTQKKQREYYDVETKQKEQELTESKDAFTQKRKLRNLLLSGGY